MTETASRWDLASSASGALARLWDRARPKKVAFRRGRRIQLLERMAKERLDEVFRPESSADAAGRRLGRSELARLLRLEKRPHMAKLLDSPELDVLRVVLCPSRTRRLLGRDAERSGGAVRVRYRSSDASRILSGESDEAASLIVTPVDRSSGAVTAEDLAGEGAMEVGGLARGNYRVELVEQGSKSVVLEKVRIVPWTRVAVDLTEVQERDSVRFGGTVRLEGGTPVPGVEVEVAREGGAEPLEELKADADGRFLSEALPPGSYRVRIDSSALSHSADRPEPIQAEPGTRVEVDFALWPNWNQPAGFLTALGVWTIQRAPDTPRRPLDHGRVLELVKALRRNGKGDLGRRLIYTKLLPLRDGDREVFDRLFREIRAELALCTAVATDLPPGPRLDEAWQLLNVDRSADLRADGPDRAVEAFVKEAAAGGDFKRLQRGGAIFTRKWDHERRKSDQETATDLYRQAYRTAKKVRQGSSEGATWAIVDAEINCGCEAAFQMDLLAEIEADSAKRRKLTKEATAIRRAVLADFETRPAPRFAGMQYRRLAHFAQLHLGLYARQADDGARAAHLKSARSLMRRIRRMHERDAQEVPLWLRDRKMRQVAQRSRLFGLQAPEVDELLGGRTHAVRAAAAGKLGLALSGGGLRASFFHLGVLAYLAELNLLRSIEVLSCVSGGSIVGTHYYLKLRRLLQDPVRAVISRLRGFQRRSRPDHPLKPEGVEFLRAVVEVLSRSDPRAGLRELIPDSIDKPTRRQGREWAGKLIERLRRELAEQRMPELDDDLRRLIENPDWRAAGIEPAGEEIDHDDYLVLIQELIEEFLAGVRKNIRTRVVASPIANVKMLLPFRYNRSNRVGELLDKHLYGRVPDGSRRRREDRRKKPGRMLSELVIRPELTESFNPVFSNWSRDNKVPNLILNATSLNTGHNWQFTAKWMGESPAVIDTAVDANARLRRVYIDEEAPPPHDTLSLGWAVATSACVPGLFDPADLKGLYERAGRRIVVRLIDGGVFDNQGLASLLEQGCRNVIVSDASGQMDFQEDPSSSPLGVPLRSNTILMDRVRQAQYRDLVSQQRSGQVRSLVFLHLKKGLDSDPVDWILCDDPRAEGLEPGFDGRGTTAYGVRRDLQRRLADIRTDLDSFCDAEAYALMYSGYQMLCKELEPCLRQAQREGGSGKGQGLEGLLSEVSGRPIPTWPFMTVSRAMSGKDEDVRLERILETANKRLFKIWRLWFPKAVWRWAAGIGLLGAGLLAGRYLAGITWMASKDSALIGGLADLSQRTRESMPEQAESALGGAADWAPWILALVLLTVAVAPRAFGWLLQKIQLLLLSTAGMVFSWFHLLTIDRAYLRYGRVGEDDLGFFGRFVVGQSKPAGKGKEDGAAGSPPASD